jgi:DNA topoisomerase-3
LALQQSEEGKWRVEFDEPWAREGAKADPAAEADVPEQQPPAAAATADAAQDAA